MERLYLVLVLVLMAVGCLAEGAIEGPDAGEQDSGGLNNVNNVNNSNNRDSDFGVDGGYEFGEVCDPFAQDCSSAGKCVPNPATGTATCLGRGEERSQGQPCETITQCAVGTHCASFPDDPTSVCQVMCDPNGVDTCPAGDTCSIRLTSVPSVGLCAPAQKACNIYAQDCQGGDACIIAQDLSTGQDGTFCGTAGTVAADGACSDSASCQAAMICVQLAGAASATCQHVCRIGKLRCPGTELSCIGQSTNTGVTFCKIP